MTFEIEINGRLRVVSVEAIGVFGPAGGRARLTLRDAESATPIVHEVDCRTTDLGLSLRFEDGRIVEVAATEIGGDWLLQFPHVDLVAAVDRRKRDRRHAGAGEATGIQRVTAPMPGRVVRLLVKPGDEVALRQGLVVVEAMKMENELVSPKAGHVKEIAVTEGVSVEAGRLLMVIE